MNTKPWYQSKTVWLNVIVVVINILAVPEFIAVVPPQALPYIDGLAAVLNVILRFITTQPLST